MSAKERREKILGMYPQLKANELDEYLLYMEAPDYKEDGEPNSVSLTRGELVILFDALVSAANERKPTFDMCDILDVECKIHGLFVS